MKLVTTALCGILVAANAIFWMWFFANGKEWIVVSSDRFGLLCLFGFSAIALPLGIPIIKFLRDELLNDEESQP